jgi:hypothetical protein
MQAKYQTTYRVPRGRVSELSSFYSADSNCSVQTDSISASDEAATDIGQWRRLATRVVIGSTAGVLPPEVVDEGQRLPIVFQHGNPAI